MTMVDSLIKTYLISSEFMLLIGFIEGTVSVGDMTSSLTVGVTLPSELDTTRVSIDAGLFLTGFSLKKLETDAFDNGFCGKEYMHAFL